ncbi:MAG: alpha/beta hydrolase [Alphaproteobacteria bacterium]|nr:alpha/beta hydrolase [Alphaproteobacteria bacterium]
MPEVIISGSEGRIEGRYHHSEKNNPPIAIVFHPHPLHGGTMNNKVVYNLYHCFVKAGFSVLRINFRGVGKSEGKFDNGIGELTDAATALDWLQLQNPTSNTVWAGGFSFGAWISMQLLMRRPEIQSFVSIAPPLNKYDFSFLSPCPVSGLILQGDQDSIVPEDEVTKLVKKIPKQKHIEIDYQITKGADHFFRTKIDEMNSAVTEYIKGRFENYKPAKAKIDRRRRQTPQN